MMYRVMRVTGICRPCGEKPKARWVVMEVPDQTDNDTFGTLEVAEQVAIERNAKEQPKQP